MYVNSKSKKSHDVKFIIATFTNPAPPRPPTPKLKREPFPMKPSPSAKLLKCVYPPLPPIPHHPSNEGGIENMRANLLNLNMFVFLFSFLPSVGKPELLL